MSRPDQTRSSRTRRRPVRTPIRTPVRVHVPTGRGPLVDRMLRGARLALPVLPVLPVLAVVPATTGPAWADDTTQPRAVVTVSRPADYRGWYQQPMDLAVAIEDETGLDVDDSRIVVTEPDLTVHGQDLARASVELSVAAQGATVVDWDVVDTSGNRAVGEVEVFLDSIAPIVVPTGLPADGAAITQGSDPVVGLGCEDGGEYAYSSGIQTGSCLYTGGVTGGHLDTSTAGPLTVTAEARDEAGNLTTVTRHYTVVAAAGKPRNVVRPSLSGDRLVDGALAADPGQWTGSVDSFSFLWLRDGSPIAGATTATYRPVPDDLGHKVKVRVTAIGDAGQRSATSTAVRIRRTAGQP